MSRFAPQQICVKRKRHEEPVDSLYFQQPGGKRQATEHEWVFKRLQNEEGGSAQMSDAQEPPRVTDVERRGAATLPRRFHLTRPASVATADAPVSTAATRADLSNVPIFVESKHRRTQVGDEEYRESVGAGSLRRLPNDTVEPVHATSPPRKRHIAGEAERQWRQKYRVQRETGNLPANENANPSSCELFDKMQRLVEEVQESEQKPPNAVHSPAKLKFKPKAVIRYKDRHPEEPRISNDDDFDAMDIDTSDDTDYIVDTYIRIPASNMTSEDDAQSKIGYIVITDQDQELWETYLEEEEESDKDWNSEEEDENAENYYGADYPEDEVDLNDEQDADPYRYRQGASDEEEWDSDAGAFSDEEDLRYPWKRHPWS